MKTRQEPTNPQIEKPGLLTAFARTSILKNLSLFRRGRLTLVEGETRMTFGEQEADLCAELRICDPLFYKHTAFGGSIGAAEAYMDGQWECDDLVSLFRLMELNRATRDNLDKGAARFAQFLQFVCYRLHDNTRRGSRRNIAAHYDLGNEMYQLFLDPTMAYSSGFFTSSESTMEEASTAKFDLICKKIQLTPETHVIEIGTGWGGFALHAVRHYGCRVTTTTISTQQHDLAAERIRAAGLEDRITLLKQDYRELNGQYDRLVSIEMIEAVGDRFLPEYFRTCSRLLKPDGLALIQAISVPDREYAAYLKCPEFINTYIFPGGCCPSIGAMSRAVAGHTDLRLVHLHDLTPHYVRTLQEWRKRFLANEQAIRALGYDDRFVRMWLYYLCYCEGAFAEQFTTVAQLLYAKPHYRIGTEIIEGLVNSGNAK
jgi:cyclopropane-fatty-acyl-phospholipid synthase